jgi:beta-glucanase (GH16 family)
MATTTGGGGSTAAGGTAVGAGGTTMTGMGGTVNPNGGTPAVGGASGGTAPVGGSGGIANPGGGTGGTPAVGGGGSGAGGAPAGGGCPNLPGVKGHPDCAATYPTHAGFTLALVEEFNAPIDLVNDPIWTYSDGHPDGPVRFVKDHVSFDGGYMNLSMDATPVAGSHSYAEEEDVTDRAYSSGEFRSKYNNYRYGRYEANYKPPAVQPGNTMINGGYVATLFIFRTPKFTQWREIDLEKTGDNSNMMATNLINGDNKAAWGPDFADTGNPATLPFNARDDFHTYAFEWTSAGVTWYVDDQMIRQQLGPAKLPIPDMSAKIMMNLWWGSFGGDGANNMYPLVTQYDWFRFYKWDMDTTYPMDDPTMLPETDRDGSKNNPEDGVTYIAPHQGN